ncbi:MAG TPA: L-threonylcarbamoyladenylate synthase, partial [Pyrinomonadaceae bacterium]|nr:L-threonylcarbamoyladenylate synthase [Pyrinomonadaceae bacterium]
TDTFYGLGADPFKPDAVRLVKQLKGRDDGKPILVLISDETEAARFILTRTELFAALSARYWPGPLTLVVRAREEVPGELTAGTATVGLRLPDDEDVRALVRACGGALTATSANLTGEAPARTAPDVARAFPENLPLIIDGGAARSSLPSTVLDVTGTRARLIREGVLTSDELQHTSRHQWKG